MNALETMVNFCRDNSKQIGLWIDIEAAAADLARITAERARYRHDLARAIAWIDEQVSFSEADKFAGTTLFETWQEVQAALKQSS